MRHVIVMSATGSIGTIANFAVDFINLFYISRLGSQELTAAVGFASIILFFPISVGIGFMIACSALVSRRLGAGQRDEAAEIGGAALLFTFGTIALMILVAFPCLHAIALMLGAHGIALDATTRFLRIVVPSMPFVAIAMCTSGILRAVGDAPRAMYVTLGAAVATALLDPLLIFGLHLGLDGAAVSTVASRLLMLAIGLHGSRVVHHLLRLPKRKLIVATARPFLSIALPAVLTQIATPVGNGYVTAQIARFGDDAVAGWTIVSRIVPIAFGGIFALSGAIGPIFSQNLGAQQYARVRSTACDSLILTAAYVAIVWAALAILAFPIASLFGATDQARTVVTFFCFFVAGTFFFNGAVFIANAAFNNLGTATYSTGFNWARATIGTVPFVWLGGQYFGTVGVIAGWGLGAVVFGIISTIVCFRVINRLEDLAPTDPTPQIIGDPTASKPERALPAE